MKPQRSIKVVQGPQDDKRQMRAGSQRGRANGRYWFWEGLENWESFYKGGNTVNQGEGHKGMAGCPRFRRCNVFETGFKPCVPEGLHQQEAGPNSLLTFQPMHTSGAHREMIL